MLALSGDGGVVAGASRDGTMRLWHGPSGKFLATLEGRTGDRHYQRLDITGLTSVTAARRAALLQLEALEMSI